MKAFRLYEAQGGLELKEAEMACPVLKPGECLIRVRAAGVTPTELHWYPTTHAKSGAPRHLAVPGHEFSGAVAGRGIQVVGFEIGDEVFGMNDWFAEGATAEFCTAKPAWIARKPARLTHAEAASAPIGALTAWQGLYDRAKLQSGERVLIHGGSGSVGVYAVQLAHAIGARVLTTASKRNQDLLVELGASQVIDYRSERFEEMARDIDVVFDAVGGDTLKRSWSVLKPGGRLVTIAPDSEGTSDERAKQAFFIVEPRGDQLAEIAGMFDAGKLRAFVDAAVPFEKAPEAYVGALAGRLGRGKIVIAIGT